MSTLRTIDLVFIDDLVSFAQGAGYVLNFSNRSFAEFFAEMGHDIEDQKYSDLGGSKGRRLKRFLQLADDASAAAVLRSLWEYRVAFLEQTQRDDPVRNAEVRYLQILQRLEKGSSEVISRPSDLTHLPDKDVLKDLRDQLVALEKLGPQERGYAFEKFLKALFEVFSLRPRDGFRVRGEQIDGSFDLKSEIYLIEARWRSAMADVNDLHSFHGKVEQKAAWTRGLFVSHSGFSEDGLSAFGRGKRLICMDGLDLYEMLDRGIPLGEVLERKARRAAETGRCFVRVRELFP